MYCRLNVHADPMSRASSSSLFSGLITNSSCASVRVRARTLDAAEHRSRTHEKAMRCCVVGARCGDKLASERHRVQRTCAREHLHIHVTSAIILLVRLPVRPHYS